jgi:transcriptional regulator with XRE-family HTH domain
MSSVTESEAFAQRLRGALDGCGVRLSPSVVANEFNLRYWGRSITPHTARNWLMGNSLPTQDKLRVLAEWLQVSPDELRFGNQVIKSKGSASQAMDGLLNLADREMLSRYLSLSVAERKTVRDVVEALTLAAGVKKNR